MRADECLTCLCTSKQRTLIGVATQQWQGSTNKAVEVAAKPAPQCQNASSSVQGGSPKPPRVSMQLGSNPTCALVARLRARGGRGRTAVPRATASASVQGESSQTPGVPRPSAAVPPHLGHHCTSPQHLDETACTMAVPFARVSAAWAMHLLHPLLLFQRCWSHLVEDHPWDSPYLLIHPYDWATYLQLLVDFQVDGRNPPRVSWGGHVGLAHICTRLGLSPLSSGLPWKAGKAHSGQGRVKAEMSRRAYTPSIAPS